ncbi:MAG: 4-hydroxy-tetrahydrodipicolinate reductase [Pseudomonadota bacterium]
MRYARGPSVALAGNVTVSQMKLAVMGAAGRMGRTLVAAVDAHPDCQLAGATEPAGSPHIGADAGELAGIGPRQITITDTPLDLFTDLHGVIDFTTPAATCAHAELAAQARIVHVIGTTGFDAAEEAQLSAAARHATIVKAGNMSLGVNLLVALTRRVAAALGEDFDIEVLEMHHRHKVDAPSGTALMLGDAAAEGRSVQLDDVAVRARDGQTGARPDNAIGFATLRGGSVIGEHSVVFAGPDERIELSHRAENRQIFANGAVRAALWGRGRKPGMHSMLDVLGLDTLGLGEA